MAVLLLMLVIHVALGAAMSTGNCTLTVVGTLDCSNRHIPEIPDDQNLTDVRHWDLSHNDIEIIKNNAFLGKEYLRGLDLSFNHISALEIDSFAGLVNLKVLNISHNRLRLPSSFVAGVFKSLVMLETLRMHGTINENAYPDEALRDLISLKELFIQGTPQTMGPGFMNLRNLEILYLSPPGCKIINVQNQTFGNLRNSKLKLLAMQHCAVSRIQEGALMHVPRLKSLNVVCNYELGIKTTLTAIANMIDNQLETLVLDDVDRSTGAYKFFTRNTVCLGNFPHLKRLSIRNNAIDSLNWDILHCMPALEVVNIGFNALTLTWGPWHIFTSATKQYWANSNLTELDMSYGFSALQTTFRPLYCPSEVLLTDQYFRQSPSQNNDKLKQFPDYEYKPTVIFGRQLDLISVNSKLQAVHLDHIHFSFTSDQLQYALVMRYIESTFCKLNMPKNDLRFLNVSHNTFDDFSCVLRGLNFLQTLDISHSKLRTVNVEMLQSLPNLRTAYLTGNELGYNSSLLAAAMQAIPQIEFLTLSTNSIKFLPKDMFLYNRELRTLDLSTNKLTDVYFMMTNLSSIETLDLSNNLLPLLKQPFIKELSSRPNLSKPLTLNLFGNPFHCDCQAIDFLQFLRSHSDHNIVLPRLSDFLCIYRDEPVPVHVFAVDEKTLQSECRENRFTIIISAVMGSMIVLLLVGSVLVFRFRWKLAWKVYEWRRLARQVKRRRSFRLPDHKYKVFVAYENTDDIGLPWMRYQLLPKVEEEWEMNAFILDRDALVGPFLEEVTNGIRKSEKKLFIITEDFVQRYHWPMVLHWCVDAGLRNLILVLLDSKIANLPPSLANVAMALEKRYPTHVLYYRQAGDNRDLWANLKIALDEDRRNRVSVM